MDMTLGRHEEHDPKSLSFSAAKAVALKDVSWTYHGQILDQGNIGSCTGNSAVEVIMTGPYYDHLQKIFIESDALSVYEQATRLDNIPGHYLPTDTGSSGLAVMKALQKRGLIRSYNHAFGITHALGALMLGPVITGVPWYEGMFNPDSTGTVHISGAVAGGHEFTVIGYDLANKRVRCINHWTAEWGDKGFFWLSQDDWARLLNEQGDVTVPIL